MSAVEEPPLMETKMFQLTFGLYLCLSTYSIQSYIYIFLTMGEECLAMM